MLQTDAPLPTLTINLFSLNLAGSHPNISESGSTGSCQYWIQLQFDDPRYPERQESLNQIVTIHYEDLNRLTRGIWEPSLYGNLLANAIFAHPSVRQYFSDAWRSAFRMAKGLRLMLCLDANAPELHSLRWETLCHPETNQFLFTDSNLPFSRYLENRNGAEWRPYELSTREELTALVVIASPNNLQSLNTIPRLMPVDVQGELARARKSLSSVQKIAVLASRSQAQKRVTLANLEGRLREGYDILYLVCHGALLKDTRDPQSVPAPFLLLEKDDGTYDRIDARELVNFIQDLTPDRRPRLVVLASCQSAGDASTLDDGALLSVGPLLAQAGVPAVLAMQSNIKMATVERFMPVFFNELLKDGHIDRAISLARGTVMSTIKKSDWWSPVLFTRLRDARLLPAAATCDDPLKNYLSIASQRLQFSRSVDRRLEVLWNQPYKGHPLDQPMAKPEELHRFIHRKAPSADPGTSSVRTNRAVLLGSNGQGKTTALRWLRFDMAKEAFAAYKDDRLEKTGFPIPIYFSLNELARDCHVYELALQSINNLLEAGKASKITLEEFEKWASKYPLLFLIDDLEVLITRQFGAGLEKLTSFMGSDLYCRHQHMLACRTSSYQSQLGVVNLIRLDDLDDKQVQSVLQEKFPKISPQMRRLARNRTVLRLVVEVDDQKMQTKGQLVKRWVEQTLNLEGETVEGLDSALIKTLLEQIAFEMRLKHKNVFRESELTVLINNYLNTQRDLYNWREVLHCMRTMGALMRDATTLMYSFTERSYADYFSAAAVNHDPERKDIVFKTASDHWWRDMFEILVGLVQNPAELLFDLIDRDVRAAANCIEYANIPQESTVYSALIDGLVEQMEHENSTRRRYMIERINASEHERVPEVLLRQLHREWSSTVILSIVKGLENKKRQMRLERLVKMELQVIDSNVQDPVSYVPWLEVPAPIRRGRERQELPKRVIPMGEYIQRMKELLENTAAAPKIRGLAAMSLGLTHEAKVMPYLLEFLRDPQLNDHVAWCITEALTEFKDVSLADQVCTLYNNCNNAEKSIDARQKARFIYLLGWSTIAEETPADTMPCEMAHWDLILGALTPRSSPVLRGYAIQTLARLGYPNAIQAIQKLLAVEKDPVVMRKAAESLGQIGTPDSIALLESKIKDVRAQENQGVRSAYRNAIREIQERYGL